MKNFSIRIIFGFLFVSLTIIATTIGLLAIGAYGVMMVVWMHAPVFQVLVLCLLFSIPLVAIVLMLKSIAFSLLRQPPKNDSR